MEVWSESDSAWHGPGARGARPKRKFSWSGLLWTLIWPHGGERIIPTGAGVILIGLSFGIGTAAYNSSSNILFITLSLLLSCLILSGVLSWLNLRGVAWKLEVTPPWRAGQMATAGLELRNRKTFLPTYGLWFEFSAREVNDSGPSSVESTITGKGIDVKAALKKASAAQARGTVSLGGRLDPQSEVKREWNFAVEKRGRLRVELATVGSLFPFGFLKKHIKTGVRRDITVWPAPVEYRRFVTGLARQRSGGDGNSRLGSGDELLALRRYATSDSHRLIHWKASARTRQLLVRQFTDEASEGFSLWLTTGEDVWPHALQFETLLSFVATLAEDLFRAGQLKNVAIDEDAPAAIRHVRDLESFLDRLAVLEAVKRSTKGPSGQASARAFEAREAAGPTGKAGKKMLTFAPDGAHGVVAYIDGHKAAAA